MHWSDLSTNPEDPQVVAWRQKVLRESQSDKVELIHDHVTQTCQGKTVLDFGYANHSSDTASLGGKLVHDTVKSCATRVIGVDIVTPPQQGLLKSNEIYFCENILEGARVSAELERVSSEVEIVLASNVLEHLNDLGSFFKVVSDLCPTAKVHILVPNPLWFAGLRDLWQINALHSSLTVDHTCLLYPSSLVELGDRFGYRLESWRYVGRGDMPKSIGFFSRENLLQPALGALYAVGRFARWPVNYNQVALEFVHVNEGSTVALEQDGLASN
jgi:hypothetical protein